VIAGRDCDGETERLQRLSATLGVRGLEFVGLQGPERLHELIAHCLFTVVPSLWYDNSPMAVLESFAWGRPVIGSNIGGIPEQITDQCGLLFEPGNVSELAEKMQILLADAAMRKQMGEAARQRVQEHFSAEKHCARLLDLFERLIDRRRQRA